MLPLWHFHSACLNFFPSFSIVHNMHELKTDVGRARGFVRLALEKKSLSRHLSELLTHEELTRYTKLDAIGRGEPDLHLSARSLLLSIAELSLCLPVFPSFSSCQVPPPLEPVHLQSSHCAHGVQYSPAHS